jgi:hypothetical protein
MSQPRYKIKRLKVIQWGGGILMGSAIQNMTNKGWELIGQDSKYLTFRKPK